MHWMGDMGTFKLYAGLAVKLESDGHKVRRWFSSPGFVKSRRLEKNGEDFWRFLGFFGRLEFFKHILAIFGR